MKKEILKGFSMLVLLVAIALATAVVSANAQSSKTVVSNIPFEFIVGGQAMPSGKYIMSSATSDGSALLVRSADNNNSVARLTNTIQPGGARTNARLVFHRYGDRYFLAEVWNGADSSGRQLTRSRQERAIQRELASIPSTNNLALSTYEVVEVVASLR